MTLLKTLASTFVAAVAATLICSPAYAIFSIQFDENGNGCVLNSDHHCTDTLVGTVETDPTGRVAGDVLVYTLPEVVIEGDVGIGEFGSGSLSDVLTFTDANGGLAGIGNLMIFYSEFGGSDVADTGWPDLVFSIGATEDANGNFHFAPGGESNNQYFGISPEGVPEPVTLSLFGAGLVGAGALRRRRKN